MSKLSIDDVVNIGFHKANIGGYRSDEVDDFINSVHETMLDYKKENEDVKKKLAVLANKINQYRKDEDSIRITLLNAQKLADASVREAKHKSEVILKDAREQAKKIVEDASNSIGEKHKELENLKIEASNFRSHLLELYKNHLKVVSELPHVNNSKKNINSSDDNEIEKLAKNNQTPDLIENKVLEKTEFKDDNENFYHKDEVASKVDLNKYDIDNFEDLGVTRRFTSLKFGKDYKLHTDNEDIEKTESNDEIF
jgi:cell division initiation protein